jgi:hypothetical protein
MGLSANRGMAQQAPVYSKTPLIGSGVPQPMENAAPQAAIQPFQYPHLQNFAQHGPLGGVLARIAMQGMENRRMQAGMSPQDWQAQIDANRTAYRRGF